MDKIFYVLILILKTFDIFDVRRQCLCIIKVKF